MTEIPKFKKKNILMHNDWHAQVCCPMFAKSPAAGENSIQSSVAHRFCIR